MTREIDINTVTRKEMMEIVEQYDVRAIDPAHYWASQSEDIITLGRKHYLLEDIVAWMGDEDTTIVGLETYWDRRRDEIAEDEEYTRDMEETYAELNRWIHKGNR